MLMAFTPTPEQDPLRESPKGVIRAFCHMGGWLLEPISERETRATLMLELDLKGGLANYVIKKALNMQGNQLKPLKAVIAKYLSENPQCPYK